MNTLPLYEFIVVGGQGTSRGKLIYTIAMPPLHIFLVPVAVFADFLLGEPRRWHPLVGFGRLAVMAEAAFHRQSLPPGWQRAAGFGAWALAVLPLIALVWWLSNIAWLQFGLAVALLYLALGAQSLGHHARQVAAALSHGQLPAARRRVSMMVSRDTATLDVTAVTRATVESVLENGSDAVFGALFWFAVLGAPGVVMYRLANTLDAMWGYRNERYLYFGWAAARLDDALNWIPARLTALTYIIVGRSRQGWRCWRQQAGTWYGINPGVVMASGAGVLNRTLGGPAPYHGKLKQRPLLGNGPAPGVVDIERSVLLVQRSLWLWVAVIFFGGWWLA